jgi:hypothetical protein
MSFLTRKQVILVKTEVAYGADPGPDPAVNALLTGLPSMRWMGDPIDRDIVKSDLSAMQHLIGIRHCEIEIPVELKGKALAPGVEPEWGPLLQACGFTAAINPGTSVTYTPISDVIPSVTLWVHVGENPNGMYTRILGCRGDFSLDIPGGSYGTMTFRMQGLYKGPEDIAMPVTTYDASLPPQLLDASAALGIFTPAISKFSLAMNNALARKLDITTTHGVGEVWLTSRRATGVIDPEVVQVATQDYWYDWLAGAEKSLSIQYGTVGGNRITITCPKAQYTGLSYGDVDGFLRMELPFKANGTALAGNDEVSIVID